MSATGYANALGAQARFRGEPADRCPYRGGTATHRAWVNGWLSEKAPPSRLPLILAAQERAFAALSRMQATPLSDDAFDGALAEYQAALRARDIVGCNP